MTAALLAAAALLAGTIAWLTCRQFERRIVDAVRAGTPVARARASLVLGLGGAAVLLAGAGYAALGRPAAPGAGPAPAVETGATGAAPHATTPQQIDTMIQRLEARLAQNPQDGEGWAMLARSHAVSGRHVQALPAFRKAIALRADDAVLLADFADTLAVTQGRRLEGEPEQWVRRALALDPGQLKALSLAGTLAFERGDFAGAARHWGEMLRLAPQSELTRQVEGGLADARARAGGGAPAAPAAAASPAGPAALGGSEGLAPALAVIRRQVRDMVR